MTAIRPPHSHAPAQRMHEIQVAPPVGKSVTLRVRGMTLGGAGAVQPKTAAPHSTSALSSAIKTALEPTTQLRTAHVARVMSTGAALELPSSVQTMANAAQALPEALRGVLVRGAVAVVGPRLAALALPTVTLAAALYPRQMGDASVPVPPRAHEVEPNATSTAFVPLAPQGLEHAEGFKPLNANDPKLYGPPPSDFTRPPTPLIRVLPVTDTAAPRLLEGGPRVDAPSVPGKAQHVASASDYWLLAEKVDAVDKPKRVPLTFTDVVVSDPKARDGDGSLVSDKRLTLKFQTGAYGGGEISVWLPDPFYRNAVQVDFKKTSQLPDGPAGEVLAHALGYTHGLTPTKRLLLKIENTDTPTPVTKDSVSAVTRWAVAMHGKRIFDFDAPGVDGYAVAYLQKGFRAAPRFFAKPNVPLGYAADGPGLDDPQIFLNRYPRGEPLRPTDDLPPGVLLAQDLTDAVHREQPNSPAVGFSYVIPVPLDAAHPIQPLISLLNASHSTLSQGRDAFGAGVGLAVYDPNFGPSGGYRNQFLTDFNSQFEVHGKKAKHTTETAFQQHLDTDGRLFFSEIPASIEPFAGLQVRRELSATSPTRYEIKIPDARALSYQGGPLQQTQTHYADLASMVIEPVQRQAGQLPLARIRKFAVGDEMWGFLPTFVGQALAAVHLTHPATREEQAFGGLLVGQEVLSKAVSEKLVNGLTIYGIEKKLGEYSPDVPFVLQRVTESGDIEFTINPAVRTQR